MPKEKTKSVSYVDDKIMVKKNDIDGIRTRPTMYVSAVGPKAVLHISKELIDNNKDECIKQRSPGDTVNITFTDKYVESSDNGRGIPTKDFQVVHEVIQAGSNTTRETGETTAGENGTGLVCITALSSDYIATTYRPTEKKKLTLHYVEGELVERIEEEYNGKESGMHTKFYPSKKILGTNKIPVEELKEWLDRFKYTIPKNITMNYNYNGKVTTIKSTPIEDYLSDILKDNVMSKYLTLEFGGDVTEVFKEEEYKKHFNVKCALVYSSSDYKEIPIRYSCMNMIYNSNNGSHVDGVLQGFNKYMTERVYKKKPALEGENLRRDIENHLQLIVIADCNMINVFADQAKQTVFPESLKKAIAEKMYETLCTKNQTDAVQDMIEVVIGNNKARKAGEEARNIKSITKRDKWEKPKKFLPCSSVKTKEPKELFLCEGESAGGGLRSGRYPMYQAILMFRGKSLNVWPETLDRVLKSEPWLNLVKILGCGIGATFDLRKLAYDKIIIMTDADIDGYHIRVQMCSMFLKFFPEIINAGKLYVAEPPLYQLAKGKELYYAASQGEYILQCIDCVGSLKTHFPMSKNYKDADSKDFFVEAFDYLNMLKECSIKRSVNPFLLEYIANGFAMYGRSVEAFKDNVDKWLRSIVNIYPETTFNHKDNQISSTIDFVDNIVCIDEELIDALDFVIRIQEKYGMIIEYDSPSRKGSNTLGKFFEIVEVVYPVIKDRYKGLGQSSASVTREVLMDPKSRRLFRVTAQDIDVMRRMSNLVGNKTEDINNRKEMLMNFHMTSDMLDN